MKKVRRIRILPRELSIGEGELTPTLKVRRKVIADRFREQIRELYDGPPGNGVIELVGGRT